MIPTEVRRRLNPEPRVVRRIDFPEAADAVERFLDFAAVAVREAPRDDEPYVDAAHRLLGRDRFAYAVIRRRELAAVGPFSSVLRPPGAGPDRGVSSSRRERALGRGRRECRMCARGEGGDAWNRRTPDPGLHVDHIIPRSLGGTDGLWNLWPLCAGCNSRKGRRLHPEGLALALDRLMELSLLDQ